MDEEETIVRLTIDGPPPTLLQKLTDGLPLSFPVELVAGMDRATSEGGIGDSGRLRQFVDRPRSHIAAAEAQVVTNHSA